MRLLYQSIPFLLSTTYAQRKMETLGRGVVAVRTGSNIFVSWRLLGFDPSGIGFNIYRSAVGANAVKLNRRISVTVLFFGQWTMGQIVLI
ncbi:hypothetical protein SAMN05518672_10468 [Chitinophaga sp. CF118]|nr:hypothetical protein SAMN05518672_10468 [Chitinophaga sp. CF118]